jgi:iron complex outermembrane receptor protein
VIYPLGFSPLETMNETDFAFTAGVKGKPSRAAGTGTCQQHLRPRQVTEIGVDTSATSRCWQRHGLRRRPCSRRRVQGQPVDQQPRYQPRVQRRLGAPLNFAIGLEQRRDTYEIVAGDPASRYKEGSQSYPGFSLTDAGKHDRDNEGLLHQLSSQPMKDLTVDLAARYEHFSDFGNAKVGKLTSRYDFSARLRPARHLQQRLPRADAGRVNTIRPPTSRRPAPSCSWRRIRRAPSWWASTA